MKCSFEFAACKRQGNFGYLLLIAGISKLSCKFFKSFVSVNVLSFVSLSSLLLSLRFWLKRGHKVLSGSRFSFPKHCVNNC